jgi:hypothetical protein
MDADRTEGARTWCASGAGNSVRGMTDDARVISWLLESDPSLRWQVERDLTDAPREQWEATRARVATEGFGARLLALQDEDGQWAGGAFFPAGFTGEDEGQPYTATTWSLNALREWGVEPEALRPGTAELLAQNARWEYDDLPYWEGEVDVCINAYTLANGAWLDVDMTGLAEWFVTHRLNDGGWNCEWVEGSARSSFHSTLNAVIGLLEYEQRVGAGPEVTAARHAGEEYLLERRLLRRLSTGEPIGSFATHPGYPYRHVYSALRAADHFRAAAQHDGTAPDERLSDAIAHIRDIRDADGTWHQQYLAAGAVWFDVDGAVGEPSRWLTFHALRTLRWWDATR